MTDWFRSWHGAPTDPKWLVIAKKADVSPAMVAAIVWALFDHASQQEDRGSVETFDTETYAVWSGLGESDVDAVIDALTEKGVIVDGRLSAWERRQPKREDPSTERVRAFRDRQRSVTDDVKRAETQRNAPEKRRVETETDAEERKNHLAADADAPRRQAAPPVPVARERNPVWDAVAALCGEPATSDERADFGKTVKQLREARASPEEIAAFGPWWWQAHPDAALTHRCLRSHWGRFRNAPARPAQLADIKNPHLRSIVTVDLDDIAAELEAKHDPPRRLSSQDGGPDGLPPPTRRVGHGGQAPRSDVLPAPRRAGPG